MGGQHLSYDSSESTNGNIPAPSSSAVDILRGLLYAVGRVTWLVANDTLFVGSPPCLYSFPTFRKCSLPLQAERLPWMLLSEPALGLLGHLSLCIFL